VAGEKYGEAVVARKAANQRAHIADPHGVQAVGRLVEQHQRGPGQQGRGNGQARLHAVAVDGHRIGGAVAQPDALEHLLQSGGGHPTR